jgi:hypothetical protein
MVLICGNFSKLIRNVMLPPMARKALVAIEQTKRFREYGATRSIRAYYGQFLFFHGKGIIFLVRRLLFERTASFTSKMKVKFPPSRFQYPGKIGYLFKQ